MDEMEEEGTTPPCTEPLPPPPPALSGVASALLAKRKRLICIDNVEFSDDDGFTVVQSKNKKKSLKSRAPEDMTSKRDTRINNYFEVCVASFKLLPKQIGLAMLLKKEGITSAVQIKYKNPYRVVISFETKEEATRLVENKTFADAGLRCYLASEVGITYGIVKFLEVDVSEVILRESLKCDYKILTVKRLNCMTEEGQWVPSETVRFGFKSASLPSHLYGYGCRFKVDPYIFPVTQCGSCWKYGHMTRTCPTRRTTCPKCGGGHTNCETTEFRCVNCRGKHMALNGTRREYAEVVPWNPVDIPEEVELLVSFPKGIVPYYINSQSYDKIITERIHAAMDTIEASSCVVFKGMEFRPTEPTTPWLHFSNQMNVRECQHEPSVGVHGEVLIVIGFECMSDANLIHTVLHAIGFKDEVSHPHRDQYIRIMWENIQPRYRNLFRLLPEDTSYKVVEYDPMSIMHFHDRAYSINGGPTIAPRVPGLLIAPLDKLSQLDVMKLRLWFGHECNKRKVGALLDKCKTVFRNSPIVLHGVVNRNQSFESVDIDYQPGGNRGQGDDDGEEETDDESDGVAIESGDHGGFDINDDYHENEYDGQVLRTKKEKLLRTNGGGLTVKKEKLLRTTSGGGLRMKKEKLLRTTKKVKLLTTSEKAKRSLFKRANVLK